MDMGRGGGSGLRSGLGLGGGGQYHHHLMHHHPPLHHHMVHSPPPSPAQTRSRPGNLVHNPAFNMLHPSSRHLPLPHLDNLLDLPPELMPPPDNLMLLHQPPLADNLGQLLVRLSKSVSMAVEVLATVGEAIGEENKEIRAEMGEACREARTFSHSLEKQSRSLSHQLLPHPSSSPPVVSTSTSTSVDLSAKPSSNVIPTSSSSSSSDSAVVMTTSSPPVGANCDSLSLVRTLRRLLSSVTRLLLLSDTVVVKLMLTGKAADETGGGAAGGREEEAIIDREQNINRFNEVVKAFCDFGVDVVHIVKIIIGDRDNLSRCSRRQAHVCFSRAVLERSAKLLTTASNALRRHRASVAARENRDTVFCQMRRTVDLVHFMVKEGVGECSDRFQSFFDQGEDCEEDAERKKDAFDATPVLKSVKYFEDSVAMLGMSSAVSDSYKEQVTTCLDNIVERTQDFTDSAYTSHERRQNILLHCDRAKVELTHLLRSMDRRVEVEEEDESLLNLSSPHPHEASHSLLKAISALRVELQQTTMENSSSLLPSCRQAAETIAAVREAALLGDLDGVQIHGERLGEHVDYVEDVAKLVGHIVVYSEQAQVRARHAQVNLHVYGPQVAVAASTLCKDPESSLALDNFEMFCGMYKYLVDEVMQVTQEARHFINSQQKVIPPLILQQPPTPGQAPPPNYQIHVPPSPLHLLDPHSLASNKFNKSVPNIPQHFLFDPNKLAPPPPPLSHPMSNFGGPEFRRHSTSSVMPGQYPSSSNFVGAPYGQHWPPQDSSSVLSSLKDTDNNDLLKRLRKMSSLSRDMQDFIRGQVPGGKVKTTQDLFTLAEYFAEECNLLYKVTRVFSYDVPGGEDKRSLMATADHLPKHCHQLQHMIQTSVVGKAATFTKVDSIIKETRQMMVLATRIVEMCHANALKYNLDFSNVSLEGRLTTGYSTDEQPFGSSSGSSGITSGNTSGNDSS